MAGLARGITNLFFFALFGIPAPAQFTVSYNGALPSQKDADLRQELQLGTPGQREGLLRALGVNRAFVHDAAVTTVGTGLRVEEVVGTDASLLLLPCSGPGLPFSHLHLLRAGKDEHWHAVDHADLDCWRQPTSFELISTKDRVSPAVLVHHVNRGHGTGLVEDHVLLFEVRGDHLVSVLETEEYMSTYQVGGYKTVEHAGTLLPFPDGSIEETRVTTTTFDQPVADDKGPSVAAGRRAAVIERRRWSWREASQSYVPGVSWRLSHSEQVCCLRS